MTPQVEAHALPDPELRAYDHAVGTLSLDGELRGYVACVVRRMTFPSRGPWPWLLIMWLDGSREPPFEDYGPDWPTVRELDAGTLEHHGPSTPRERRILGTSLRYSVTGESCTFDVAWLGPDDSARTWAELGITDDDF